VFELKHHSPSAVSKFIENRFIWWTQKTGQTKFKSNVAMEIGTAVEAGINHWLMEKQPDVKECVALACEVFKKNTIGWLIMPEDRALIPKCVNEGIASVAKNYGSEVNQCKCQEEFKIPIEGLTFPAYGKYDWFFPSRIVDNKVVGKSPSELSQAYKIQGAVYKLASGKPVDFHFIVKNKTIVTKVITLTDEDFDYGIKLFKKAAKAIERVVEIGQNFDFETVKSLFFPDPSASWNKDEAREVMEFFDKM
jgi:hypothetical protein